MIKLTEGGFADLWRGEKTPEVIAISYALQMQVRRVVAASEKTKCYSDIDQIDEDMLDYFAVEMRTMYYDQSLPIDKKRAIIKNTLNWYTKGGTASAVKELLSIAFQESDLEEWFDYDGDPFHFRAVIPVSQGEAVGDMNRFRELILKIKNLRSHVDELVLEERTVLKLKTTEGKYRLCPPRCGTIPRVSTGFNQDKTILALQTDAVKGRSRILYAEGEHHAGTAPETSTGFVQDKSNLQLQTADMDGTTRIPQASEDFHAGSAPRTSTGFVSEGADVILSGDQQDGVSRMPHTGVINTDQEGGLIK